MTRHQRILTVSQVGPTPMFSKSCAIHTISTSGHQWSFWPGGMFLDPVCTFTRCQPFAFGVIRVVMSEPSLNVQVIGCRARVGTHEMHDLQTFILVFNTIFRCSLVVHACPLDGHVGHRASDFTYVSLNIFHVSKIVCKRSVANVFILFGKRVILTFFLTLLTSSHSHAGQSLC